MAAANREARPPVNFRVGGRESMPRYGGAFSTMREARIRRDLIGGELAALRVPELRLAAQLPQSPCELRLIAGRHPDST
jgi:hypothetical protein